MAEKKLNPKVETLSFEEALNELENIVEQLERGNESLSQSVDLYERGVELKSRCESLLREARMKVEKIEARAEKAIGTTTVKNGDDDDIPF